MRYSNLVENHSLQTSRSKQNLPIGYITSLKKLFHVFSFQIQMFQDTGMGAVQTFRYGASFPIPFPIFPIPPEPRKKKPPTFHYTG